MSNNMPDVQMETDGRNISIDKVGIRNIRFPITVLDKKHKQQNTVAYINMYVNLPHNHRGTHMSRFVEILHDCHAMINADRFEEVLQEIRKRLIADSAHMEVSFPYFMERTAPVSKVKSLMDYQARFIASLGENMDFILEVKIPVMTLCPCSKEISLNSSHNQRSYVTVQVRWGKEMIWIEELVELVESCASTPVYALLKREDEKFVTEQAYGQPRFVEDLVRDVSLKLIENQNIIWFFIESENLESIHNHNAYAVKEWSRS